jgi:hypothetical protein
MIQYKGYLISTTTLQIDSPSSRWRSLGTVFKKTPRGLIKEVHRLEGAIFQIRQLAEDQGVVLCKNWIDDKAMQKERRKALCS